MSRVRRVALLLAALLVLAGPARAQDAAAMDGAPAAAPAAGDPAQAMTMEDVEARLRERVGALVAMVVLKYGVSVAGAVLLVLYLVRRRDVRAGHPVPMRASSPPPSPFPVAAALGLVLVNMAAMAGLGALALRATGRADDAAGLPVAWRFGITGGVSLAVAAFVHARLRRARGLAARTPWPAGAAARVGLGGWMVSSVVVVVLTLVVVLVLRAAGETPRPQDLVRQALARDVDPLFLALLGVLGVVVAPVTEECLFRAGLFGSLREVVSPVAAAAVSSTVFAAVHDDWTALLPLFGLAMILCWVYERTGSLVAPIAVHALNNASSLLPIFLLHA